MEKWSVTLPQKLSHTAVRVARSESRTKSELVREALRVYISQVPIVEELTESPRLTPHEVVAQMRETGIYGKDFLNDLAEALEYADQEN